MEEEGAWRHQRHAFEQPLHPFFLHSPRSVRCTRNPLRAVPIISSVYCGRVDETAGADSANDDDFTSTDGSPIHLVPKDVARDDRAQILDAGDAVFLQDLIVYDTSPK